jgi:hypothetical protein
MHNYSAEVNARIMEARENNWQRCLVGRRQFFGSLHNAQNIGVDKCRMTINQISFRLISLLGLIKYLYSNRIFRGRIEWRIIGMKNELLRKSDQRRTTLMDVMLVPRISSGK